MAWEKLTPPQRRGAFLALIGLSLIWTALIIGAARLTGFDEPYLPFAIAGGLAFFLRGGPSRWEVYAWLLISVVFVKIIHLPEIPFWVLRVASGFAALGFAALLLLGLRALWSPPEGRAQAAALLVPSLILVAFIFITGNALRFSGRLSPQTDDAWLYVFDGSLGFQPSFFVGRAMYTNLVLARSAMLTYLSLPFAMAVVCAWRIPRAAKRISWNFLVMLTLAGVAGFLLYHAVPGTGPIYAFGRGFPWHPLPYKDLAGFPVHEISIPLEIPRNAMPSLHVGWALLLVWNSRSFPRALRAALLLYLLLTVVATLGSGQHYFVDLVVSVPFVLAVAAATCQRLPLRGRRIATLLAASVMVAGWLLLVRFGESFALTSRVIPWTLTLATISVSIWLERDLARMGAANASCLESGAQPAANMQDGRDRQAAPDFLLSRSHKAGS